MPIFKIGTKEMNINELKQIQEHQKTIASFEEKEKEKFVKKIVTCNWDQERTDNYTVKYDMQGVRVLCEYLPEYKDEIAKKVINLENKFIKKNWDSLIKLFNANDLLFLLAKENYNPLKFAKWRDFLQGKDIEFCRIFEDIYNGIYLKSPEIFLNNMAFFYLIHHYSEEQKEKLCMWFLTPDADYKEVFFSLDLDDKDLVAILSIAPLGRKQYIMESFLQHRTMERIVILAKLFCNQLTPTLFEVPEFAAVLCKESLAELMDDVVAVLLRNPTIARTVASNLPWALHLVKQKPQLKAYLEEGFCQEREWLDEEIAFAIANFEELTTYFVKALPTFIALNLMDYPKPVPLEKLFSKKPYVEVEDAVLDVIFTQAGDRYLGICQELLKFSAQKDATAEKMRLRLLAALQKGIIVIDNEKTVRELTKIHPYLTNSFLLFAASKQQNWQTFQLQQYKTESIVAFQSEYPQLTEGIIANLSSPEQAIYDNYYYLSEILPIARCKDVRFKKFLIDNLIAKQIPYLLSFAHLYVLVKLFKDDYFNEQLSKFLLAEECGLFFKIIRCDNDLQKLCSILPHFVKQESAMCNPSLARFMQYPLNKSRLEQLQRLVDDITIGGKESRMPDLAQNAHAYIAGKDTKIGSITISEYGNFNYKGVKIHALKVIIPSEGETYVQVRLENKGKILLRINEINSKRLMQCGIIVNDILKDRDFALDQTVWDVKKAWGYAERFDNKINTNSSMCGYVLGLVQQRGIPVNIFIVNCDKAIGEEFAQQAQDYPIEYKIITFGNDGNLIQLPGEKAQHESIYAFSNQRLKNLPGHYTIGYGAPKERFGDTFDLLRMRDKGKLPRDAIIDKAPWVYLFSRPKYNNYYNHNVDNLLVLQQLARVATPQDSIIVDSDALPYLSSRVVKQAGWGSNESPYRIEAFLTRYDSDTGVFHCLTKESEIARIQQLKKSIGKNPNKLDLSLSADPIRDLQLLQAEDLSKIKTLDLSYALVTEQDLPDLVSVLNDLFDENKPVIQYIDNCAQGRAIREQLKKDNKFFTGFKLEAHARKSVFVSPFSCNFHQRHSDNRVWSEEAKLMMKF